MKIGVLGTGVVGATIGSKLIDIGHTVKLGSRTADNSKATAWTKSNGANATHGTFSDAASFGELIFNCTVGVAALEALYSAGSSNIGNKIIVDVSNPLDFSKGMPPSLAVCNTESLAEQIQKAFPSAKVVKTLNTMNCNLMVNPAGLPGDHDVFVSGDDASAKNTVIDILKKGFGWKSVIDLGDITSARGTEMILPLWVRLYGSMQNPNFNFKVVVGPKPQ